MTILNVESYYRERIGTPYGSIKSFVGETMPSGDVIGAMRWSLDNLNLCRVNVSGNDLKYDWKYYHAGEEVLVMALDTGRLYGTKND